MPHQPNLPRSRHLNRKCQALSALVLTVLVVLVPVQFVRAESTTIKSTSAATTSESSTAAVIEPSTAATTAPILGADLQPEAIDWADPQSLANTSWPTLEQVAAMSYVVIDRLSGSVLLAKDEQTPLNPASTTKILTALLVLENLSLDQQVTASAAAVKLDWDATKAGFVAGETTTVRDALAGLMLPSGNDAANMLAEAISGDVPAFAEKMNQRARELNAQNTHFVNPHGLSDGEHKTSTYDLALIAAEAMRYPAFRELVSTSVYALAATNKHLYNGWGILTNTNNRLLLADHGNYRSALIASVTGIKTGSTKAAGQCLVTAATTTDGVELICVLFGVDLEDLNGNAASYTRTLLEAAAQKAVLAEPTEKTVIISQDQAIDLPDTKLQAIPTRSLRIINHGLQATGSPTDLQLSWPSAENLSADTTGELAVVQDQRTILTIPVQFKAKPVVSPLDQLTGGNAAGDTTGQASSAVQSILEWPLLMPLLWILGSLAVLIFAFCMGLFVGHRRRR